MRRNRAMGREIRDVGVIKPKDSTNVNTKRYNAG